MASDPDIACRSPRQSRRKRREQLLDSVELLSSLGEEERAVLSDALEVREFKEGQTIVSEGEEGDRFFIIESGEVSIRTSKASDRSKVIAQGGYFGEVALLTAGLRRATVTATTATRCLTLNRAMFKRLLSPLEEILRRNMEIYAAYEAEAEAAAAETALEEKCAEDADESEEHGGGGRESWESSD